MGSLATVLLFLFIASNCSLASEAIKFIPLLRTSFRVHGTGIGVNSGLSLTSSDVLLISLLLVVPTLLLCLERLLLLFFSASPSRIIRPRAWRRLGRGRPRKIRSGKTKLGLFVRRLPRFLVDLSCQKGRWRSLKLICFSVLTPFKLMFSLRGIRPVLALKSFFSLVKWA